MPDVVLELDHIHPKSQGGADTEANFAAACQDCNRGKGARILGALPISKTLVGKWFHILNSEGYAAYQGQIVGVFGERVEVQVYDWMMGDAAYGTQIMPFPNDAWRLYSTNAEMVEAWEQSYCPPRHHGRSS